MFILVYPYRLPLGKIIAHRNWETPAYEEQKAYFLTEVVSLKSEPTFLVASSLSFPEARYPPYMYDICLNHQVI